MTMIERIKIFTLLLVFLFILIVLKVFYIQVFSYNKLNSKATGVWSRNLPPEANRGNIYDSEGVLLAGNVTTTSLVLIFNQMKDKSDTASDELVNL